MTEHEIISLPCGRIRGQKTRSGYSFLAVPYGRAQRFRPPVPARWEGVLDCVEYGSCAPQPRQRGQTPADFSSFHTIGSEDCLNLNIWTKHIQPQARRPVVVYVHGGAFQYGRNSVPDQAGDRFMEEDDMVFVSVNYRVGILGFLELGAMDPAYRGSGNCGIWDLLTAIRWVRENIAQFGGDPEQITLMGISAGAKSIGALLTLPEIQESCHSVILESGCMQAFRTVETARRVARRYLAYLPSGSDPRTAPLDVLLAAEAKFCACDGNTCFFGPVLTAPFRPDWRERWESGERFHGRAILGGCRHELIGLVQKPGFSQRAEQVAMELFGSNGSLAIEKHRELVEASVESQEAWEQVFSDFMYRFYTTQLAEKLEAEGNSVWSYSFDYGIAGHGMGFGYLMLQLTPPGAAPSPESEAKARPIAEFMRARFRSFILSGDPGTEIWPRYQGGYKMVFDQNPHMEYRPDDTLTGFPDQVYALIN